MYQIIGQTIIFDWDFNQVPNNTILNDIASCDTIIFNDYDDLDTCLITNNKYDNKYRNKWKKSKFNRRLNNLPPTIRDLTFGYWFSKRSDNLPNSIINLTLGDGFNQCLDNLPSSINKITFRILWNDFTEFRKEIKKIPKNLTIVDISKAPNNSDLKKQFEKFNVEIIE